AGRRVRNEGQVVRRGAQEAAERLASGVEEALQLPAQETDRLTLQPVAEPRLLLQDRAGARPEGAVVQKRNDRIERPEPAPATGWGSLEGHDSASSVRRRGSSTATGARPLVRRAGLR